VLALVRPAGPACHTGTPSCFGAYDADAVARLDRVIDSRASADAPDTSYTAKLLLDRNLRMKKIGEEAAEFTVACADRDAARAVDEGADLVYHAAVALRALGASLGAVRRALASRER
jgi:phosphoribosyl-ATP pyrophosphohydrolase/phosphoribosyl-AMP cyclohydrolase